MDKYFWLYLSLASLGLGAVFFGVSEDYKWLIAIGSAFIGTSIGGTIQRVQPVARALLSHFFRKFIIRCIAWIQTLAFPFDSKTRKFVPCAAQFDATHTEHGMCAIQYPAHS